MEEWQICFITTNLPYLIRNIECTEILFAELQSMGCLSRDDKERISCREGSMARASALLETLQSRTSGYKSLALALFNGNQTGALVTLLQGIEANTYTTSSLKYCGIKPDTDIILRMKAIFGNTQGQLANLLPGVDSNVLYSMVVSSLDASTYHKILQNETVAILASTIPRSLAYYIPRSIILCSKLRKSAFQQLSEDIFLFEGVQWHELTHIVLSFKTFGGSRSDYRVPSTDLSSNQLNTQRVRFMLLEHSYHMETIAKSSGKCTHWVKVCNNEFFLVKSLGINSIRKIRPHLENFTLWEDEFIESYNSQQTGRDLVLCDSPGMGKSVFLAQIARHLEAENIDGVTVLLKADKLVELGTKFRGERTSDKAVRALSAVLSTNQFGENMLHKLFTSKLVSVHLLVDAFDELDALQRVTCKELLRALLEKRSYFRLIITSRHHSQDELENLLNIAGHRLLPFQESDKIVFFLKYWENRCLIKWGSETQKYAERCIKNWGSSVSSEERELTGIPLQCQMLAEVYSSAAASIVTIPDYPIEFGDNVCLIDLYSQFINICFARAEYETEYVNYHTCQAFHVLFPSLNFEYIRNTEFCFNHELVFKIGLLEIAYSGQQTFVHRTFAEYLVAKYMSIVLVGDQHSQCTKHMMTLTNAIFECSENTDSQVTFLNRTVLFLLNGIIQKQGGVSKVAKSLFLHTIPVKTLRRWVLGFAEEKLEYLFKLLLCNISEGQQSWIDPVHDGLNILYFTTSPAVDYPTFSNVVCHCARHTSANIFRYFWELQFLKMQHQISLHASRMAHQKIAIIAVEYGNYEIFNYLLSLDREHTLNHDNVLTKCVKVIPKCNIIGKLEVLKLLLKEYPNCIKENAHLEKQSTYCLIKTLLNEGADLEATNGRSECIAHTALKYCSANEYYELVCLLAEHGKQHLFNIKDNNGDTPLHKALRRVEKNSPLSLKTIAFLVKNCAISFSNKNKKGMTEFFKMLFCACDSPSIENWLKYLLDLGHSANTVILDSTSRMFTPIFVPIEFHSHSVLKMLLEAGANVNQTSFIKGATLTPVAFAILSDNKLALEALLEAGADVNQPVYYNGYRRTLLSVALEESNDDLIIKILLKAGCDVNARFGKHLDTHISFVLKKGSSVPALVKLLLEAGADANAAFLDGDNIVSPLDYVAQGSELWQVLSLKGAKNSNQFTKLTFRLLLATSGIFELENINGESSSESSTEISSESGSESSTESTSSEDN